MKNMRLNIIAACLITLFACNGSIYAKVQDDFIITKEDIENAIPTTSDVNLTGKMRHELKVMEKRHFENTSEFDSDKYRVAKLEQHLLGRTWEYSAISDRMRRLKLASQRKMLSGMSLPVGIRRYISPERIANDSTPIYENDNVGIIDGLMKLYAPDAYEVYSNQQKRIHERYNDG